MLALGKSSQRLQKVAGNPMSRAERYISVLIVAFGVGFLLPASLTFGVQSLRYDSELGQIVQAREAMFSAHADWRAELHELQNGQWGLICYGGGDGSFYPSGASAKPMSIDVWVGQDGCEARMVEGATYRVAASWTRKLFIWHWVAKTASEAFTWP